MDQRWSHSDERYYDQRYAPTLPSTAPHQPPGHQQQQHPLNGNLHLPSTSSNSALSSLTPSSRSQSMAYVGDNEGDLSMEDPQDADPYNKQKYEEPHRDFPTRANHRHRPSSQYMPQEESTAARRYSPMALSPTSPYSATPQNAGGSQYSPYSSSRQSPTRPSLYSSHSQPHYSPTSERK